MILQKENLTTEAQSTQTIQKKKKIFSFLCDLCVSVVKIKAVTLCCFLALTASCVVMPDPRGNLPDEGGTIPQPGNTGAPSDYAAFVATTDYALTGGFGVIGLDTRDVYSPDPAWATQAVSPDPVATAYGNYVFVINRFTYDSITVLEKSSLTMVNQYSVNDPSCNPSNPHDLAFVSETKAYLSRYECRDLWIINPVSGEFLGAIDLAAAGYGGSDGIPEMSGLLIHGATLYVAIQLLDRSTWTYEARGRLVLINIASDSVAGDIVLTGGNPVTDLFYSPDLDRIVVGEVGDYLVIGDGGIEAINPYTMAAEGFIINETALMGNLADFAIASAGQGYATITDSAFNSVLIAFDPSTGTRDPTPVYSAQVGFSLWDMALNDRGELYLCDRTATAPGIVIVDTLNNDAIVTQEPINLGLPPFSIVFLK